MRLHSLESMGEEGLPFEIYRSSFGYDATFCMTPRPESMPHRAPWTFWVRAEIALSILAHVEAGCRSRNGQIHDACFVRDRLDRV